MINHISIDVTDAKQSAVPEEKFKTLQEVAEKYRRLNQYK